MDENREMLELLRRIEKANRRQVRIGWVLCALALVCVGACVALFLTARQALPQLNQMAQQAMQVLGRLETVLIDLEQVTKQLSELDLGAMVTDVDELVQTAQSSLNMTMEKLGTINFATLNQAIEDLAAVVEPLAKLPSLFR